MKSQGDEGTVESEQSAPEQGAEKEQPSSFSELIMQTAADMGVVGKQEEPVKSEETKVEDQPETTEEETEERKLPETPAEGEDVKEEAEEEEEKPAAKRDEWPESAKTRVAEETAKRKRANERATRVEDELSKAQQKLEELEAALSRSSGPAPTVEQPLIDIQTPVELDDLETVYDKLVETDIEDLDDEGLVTVPSGIKNGKMVFQRISPTDARTAQIRAQRLLRKDIPRRREYLAERAKADADATAWYPDLKDTSNQFTQLVNDLSNKVLSGKAMSDPQVKLWVAHAVYGFIKRREEANAAGANGSKANEPVKRIVESSRTKLAPSASRTRSIVERKPSADLAKAEQQFEKSKTEEDAQAYVQALLSQKGQKIQRVQPVAE